MIRPVHVIITITVLMILCAVSQGAEYRYPPPEFETAYEYPTVTYPSPRQNIYSFVDLAVLLAALGLSSYLVLRKRSRTAVFALMIFSLLYFGFWRKGCVCSVGAVQNVALSLFDPTYAVPVVVLLFFVLPLVFTLFFGRIFCAAVCPLGAIQDLVLLRPISVPAWLESGLRLFAYVYLAAAVMFAATGSAFIICRYDPFVSFFRLSGNLNILTLGGSLLVVSLFVGRPYCRFVCPYGVILRQLSRLSKWQVSITPQDCVRCGLCKDACPFGAISQPAAGWTPRDYAVGRKRLTVFLLLLPVLILLGGWTGTSIKTVAARVHPSVRLAERIFLEDTGKVEDTTDASLAFRATGKPTEQLYTEASNIRATFTRAGWLFGGFVGLIIGFKLIGLSVWRQRDDYQADRASCLACGRCYNYCPVQRASRKKSQQLHGQV